MFSEDIEPSIAPDKADERDCPTRDVVHFRQCELLGWQDRDETSLLDQL
jgi:hypothetical protein